MLDKNYTIIASRDQGESARICDYLRTKDVPSTTALTNTIVSTLAKIEELHGQIGLVVMNPTMDLFYDDKEFGPPKSTLRKAHGKNFRIHNSIQYFFMMLIDLCPQLLLDRSLEGTLHFLSLGGTNDIDEEMHLAGREIKNVIVHTRKSIIEALTKSGKLPRKIENISTTELFILLSPDIK